MKILSILEIHKWLANIIPISIIDIKIILQRTWDLIDNSQIINIMNFKGITMTFTIIIIFSALITSSSQCQIYITIERVKNQDQKSLGDILL